MPIAGCFGFVVIRENDDDTWQILEDYSMLPPNYSCGMKGFKYFIQPVHLIFLWYNCYSPPNCSIVVRHTDSLCGKKFKTHQVRSTTWKISTNK